MKPAVVIVLLLAAALVLPFFIPGIGRTPGNDPTLNLPWQIEVDGRGGSRVFGIEPGVSLLGDARRYLGNDFEVAVVATPGEAGSLEAYYPQVALGFVLARVVLAVDAKNELIFSLRERSPRAELLESGARKFRLHGDDLARVDALPVRSISIIPQVNLDEATLRQRFGPPEERLVVSPTRIHLLYPAWGLDVVLDADGKELFQYVAPRDFAALRAPLPSGRDAAR